MVIMNNEVQETGPRFFVRAYNDAAAAEDDADVDVAVVPVLVLGKTRGDGGRPIGIVLLPVLEFHLK